MPELSEEDMLEKLRGFDTPSITNVVATYPDHPLCLGLYDPWRGKWYTDESVRCVYPELGPLVGYAVTVVCSLPSPGSDPIPLASLADALWKSRKPSIIIIEQDFPEEIRSRVGLCGGQMTALFKACGAVGVVTNGPSRDVDEIRPLEFQYLMSGITPGHGDWAIRAINVPVSVAGMDVAPGDMIHMDENGACKFPAERLADVCRNIDGFVLEEAEQAGALNAATTRDEVMALLRPPKE